MTKTTENPADPNEVERLRSHNAELLTELKAAKAKATTLQSQLSATTDERDAALAQLRTLRLDDPVRELLNEIAQPGTTDVVARMLQERGIVFDLEGDEIVVRDGDGNPAAVIDPPTRNAPAPKPRPAKFDASDLKLLMTEEGKPEAERHPLAQAFPRLMVGSKASGSGSTGGAGRHSPTAPATPAAAAVPAPKTFGLS